MQKRVIVFLGIFFLLTGCSIFEKENFSKSFLAETHLVNNFTEYKSAEKTISLNKLEVVDDKTSLNGLSLFSESSLDEVQIKILPCAQMPLEINRRGKILGDCFEINPGTIFEVSREDFLVFPQKIFKNIEDYNFGQSQEKGGVLLMHSTNEKHWDETFSGDYILNNNGEIFGSLFYPDSAEGENTKIYFIIYPNFNGYYYIDFEERQTK